MVGSQKEGPCMKWRTEPGKHGVKVVTAVAYECRQWRYSNEVLGSDTQQRGQLSSVLCFMFSFFGKRKLKNRVVLTLAMLIFKIAKYAF